MEYRLVGAQDPANRIDRVVVEEPSEDLPEGRVLELNGKPVTLSDEQVQQVSGFVRLEAVQEGDTTEAAVFTAEDYPDEQSADQPVDEAPAEAQPAPGQQPPAPEAAQPEPQRVSRPRAPKEA